jgi:hypothetical protein
MCSKLCPLIREGGGLVSKEGSETDRTRWFATLVAFGALVFLSVLLSSAASSRTNASQPPQVFDLRGNPVRVGSVVAQLTPTEDGCTGTAGVEVRGSGANPGPDVSLAVTEDCKVFVKEIVPVSGPHELVDPPTDEGGTAVPPEEFTGAPPTPGVDAGEG